VPFENLDISLGRSILLDEQRIFEKLVRRRRGGFCYERNGLFAATCHYHQTSPESPFTRRSICTLALPGGRLTLSDMRLIVTLGGKRTERLVGEVGVYNRHCAICSA
jgi:arylamine N-acetyltransferase